MLAEEFARMFPGNKEPEAWAAALNAILPTYGIDANPQRLAAFLAQCGHESNGFTAVVENLNYSASALTATWPKRFPADVAAKYARQPEKIANRAYADRMGNGPEESGDGWRYRGRGVIQLTGRSNYAAFGKAAGRTLEEVAAYLETKQGAVEAAAWYWQAHNLNALADAGKFQAMTRAINGGLNGYDDRLARYERYIAALA